jgi:hypothetical protein
MAAFGPFAIVTASVTGKTVNVPSGAATASASGTLDSTNGFAPNILVGNLGATNVFFRISRETAPSATVNDVPLPANTVRLYANPNPTGMTGIAVAGVTVSNTLCFFCPGEGGDV